MLFVMHVIIQTVYYIPVLLLIIHTCVIAFYCCNCMF